MSMWKITSGSAPRACTSSARATSGVTTDDASAIGPRMIIKHPTDPIDQLGETLAAVRRGMRVVQPGLKPGRIVGQPHRLASCRSRLRSHIRAARESARLLRQDVPQ